MSIKLRLSLVFVGLSLLLLAGTLAYIRSAQEASRQEEFYERLQDHALRIAGLLGEVREADRERLELLGEHSIHQLYDEKVLVFDANDRLLYASLDNEVIPYSHEGLRRVRDGEALAYRDDDGDEVVGVHVKQGGRDLVVLASAYDRYGRQEVRNLTRTLWISLALGSLFIFGAGYFYTGLAFQPIERLNAAISGIDVDRLDQRLPVRDGRDEIGRLAGSYNRMLDRLREAFDLQKAFVNNASHELRTPLARMNAQVERAMAHAPGSPAQLEELRVLQGDIAQQASLVESLLLLQRLQSHLPAERSLVRVDEVLFTVLEEVRANYPALRVDVDLAEGFVEQGQLSVSMNELLLRTALRNLMVNAATYSTDGHLGIRLKPVAGKLRLVFANRGGPALPERRLFEPFFRGDDPRRIKGNGLGLSIVRQVAEDAGGMVHYEFVDGMHRFEVILPVA
ncbi:MAG: HAMP domain-containing protein [Flavobacteriales bacterium]|nr:HAMP domain-containing protein [Flavobacteriales bacterium]